MNSFIEAHNIGLVFKPKDRAPVTALSNFNLEVGRGTPVNEVLKEMGRKPAAK